MTNYAQVDLNAPVVGEASKHQGVLPDGTYTFSIEKVYDWKPKVNVTLPIKRNGVVVETLSNYTTYSAGILMRVADGEYAGATTFYNVFIHPNTDTALKNLIFACGLETLAPVDLKTLEGKLIVADTRIKERVVTKVDPNTAEDIIEKKQQNELINLNRYYGDQIASETSKLDINTDDLPF